MSLVYLELGGNIGDTAQYIAEATRRLAAAVGPVRRSSSLYQTEPWGYKNQRDFLNQIVVVETDRSPGEVFEHLQHIERQLGRVRQAHRNAARTIDIDVLFYDDAVIHENDLIIPHPRLHLRSFVLTPLCEIAPELVHPLFEKTIRTLVDECEDTSTVKKVKA